MSPASQGPHSFQGRNTHRRTRSRTSKSHEVSNTVLSCVISHGCSCYILICQARKLFAFLNQSVEPIFYSMGVSKLFNSALAVLVLGPLVQHHFSTLPRDAASVCRLLTVSTVSVCSCPYIQLFSVSSSHLFGRTLPIQLGFFTHVRSSMVKTEGSKGRRRVEQEVK